MRQRGCPLQDHSRSGVQSGPNEETLCNVNPISVIYFHFGLEFSLIFPFTIRPTVVFALMGRANLFNTSRNNVRILVILSACF